MGPTQRGGILGIVNSDPVARKSEDTRKGITIPSSSKPTGEQLLNDQGPCEPLISCTRGKAPGGLVG